MIALHAFLATDNCFLNENDELTILVPKLTVRRGIAAFNLTIAREDFSFPFVIVDLLVFESVFVRGELL
jgi:type III secretory pathway component EscR